MAYAPRIQTRTQLKQYIMRQLGAHATKIELTDDNLEDCIENALDLFMQNAFSGVVQRFTPLKLVEGQQVYSLPYEVYSILSVRTMEMGGITNSAPSNIFSMNQFVASDLYRAGGRIDLLTYELTNELMSTLDIMFSKKVTFDFNCVSKDLYLFEIPTTSETAMVECYIKNVPQYKADPAGGPDIETTNIYNELIVRNLATAYARRQWADNLSKYNGSQLPNGVNIDVPTLIQRAEEAVTKYEMEIYDNYSLPVDLMIG